MYSRGQLPQGQSRQRRSGQCYLLTYLKGATITKAVQLYGPNLFRDLLGIYHRILNTSRTRSKHPASFRRQSLSRGVVYTHVYNHPAVCTIEAWTTVCSDVALMYAYADVPSVTHFTVLFPMMQRLQFPPQPAEVRDGISKKP